MPDFEVYRRDGGRGGRERSVTIQRGGTIALNAASYESLGSPDAVELMYDAQTRIIGLRAVEWRERHAHAVRPATRRPLRGPFLVSATAFMNHYRIDTSVGRRWIGYLEGDVLCVDTTLHFVVARPVGVEVAGSAKAPDDDAASRG